MAREEHGNVSVQHGERIDDSASDVGGYRDVRRIIDVGVRHRQVGAVREPPLSFANRRYGSFFSRREIVDEAADAARCRADARAFLSTGPRADRRACARAATDAYPFFFPRPMYHAGR